MNIHVLPGDAQVEEFRKTGIEGEVVVCREALVEGNVEAPNLAEFWSVRADYWKRNYPESAGDYHETVVSQFEKLIDLPASTEVNLWFEYELFCNVNLWFCVWLLRESKAELYRVSPIAERKGTWSGFSRLTADDLKLCYSERARFTDPDVKLGTDLWLAFQSGDHARLRELSKIESACFPYLREACEAEIDKEFRPKQVLTEIRDQGITDFGETFAAFRERAGVYGFGDQQVKKLLTEI